MLTRSARIRSTTPAERAARRQRAAIFLLERRLQLGPGEPVLAVDPAQGIAHGGCGRPVPITGGDLRLSGHTVKGPQTDVGIVFQNALLLPWRNILSNVMLPMFWSARRLANNLSSSSGSPICAIGPNLPKRTLTGRPVLGSVPKMRSPLSRSALASTSLTFGWK